MFKYYSTIYRIPVLPLFNYYLYILYNITIFSVFINSFIKNFPDKNSAATFHIVFFYLYYSFTFHGSSLSLLHKFTHNFFSNLKPTQSIGSFYSLIIFICNPGKSGVQVKYLYSVFSHFSFRVNQL